MKLHLPPLLIESLEPLSRDPECRRCSWRTERTQTPCMQAHVVEAPAGAAAETLLVVMGAPTIDEDTSGVPYSSRLGSWVVQEVQRLWRGRAVFTYAAKCGGGGREKNKGAAECAHFLKHEIDTYAPSRILCLGNEAVSQVYGKGLLLDTMRRAYAFLGRGEQRVPCYLVLSPQRAVRNRFLRRELLGDIKYALLAPIPEPLPEVPPTLVTTETESRAALEELAFAEWAVLDVETFGRIGDPEFKVLTLAISSGDGDVCFVWEREALEAPWCAEHLIAFAKSGVKLVAHNAKFDMQALARHLKLKAPVRAHACTRVWRRLLLAHATSAKLSAVQALVGMGGGKSGVEEHRVKARERLKRAAKVPTTLLGASMHAWSAVDADRLMQALERINAGVPPNAYDMILVPPDVRAEYCATDTVSTGRLFRLFKGELESEPGLHGLWQKVGQHLAHAIAAMEFNGVLIDKAKLHELTAVCDARIADARVVFERYELANDGSKAVSLKLYDELKLPAPKDRNTEKDTLKALKHELADAVIAHRNATKFRSTYAVGMLPFIQSDGRVRASMNIDGTEGGRLSCDNPNIYNIPKAKSPMGKLCRDMFIAGPGSLLVELDYSQAEICIAAGLSGDEKMLALLRAGVDFHLATAKKLAPIFNIKPEDVVKGHWLRDAAKVTNFAIIYGKQERSLANDLNISVEDARKIIAGIRQEYAQLTRWIQTQLENGRRFGFTRTWWDGQLTRIRPLWAIAESDTPDCGTAERSTYNTTIQGTAQEYTGASLGALQQWIEAMGYEQDVKLVLTVYDSIIIEAREDLKDVVCLKAMQIMESWPKPSDVPLKVEVKTGRAWGTLEDWHPPSDFSAKAS